MGSVVLASLIPVVLLIALGFAAARLRIVGQSGAKDLANLAFLVLSPALLFRAMAQVRAEALDFTPAAAYLAAATLLFGTTLLRHGLTRRGAVLGLACTFSNTVTIGIPLITLAYGDKGLVILLTLVSVHALVLLTLGTVALETAVTREAPTLQRSTWWQTHGATIFSAAKSALIHPVPIPILAGLIFAQTGWVLPDVVDKALQWLGNAFGPLALLLVGVTLAAPSRAEHWKTAFGLVLSKCLGLPLLVLALGLAVGLRGLPLAVMVVTATLPTGANVFLFSQRYSVAQNEVTATVALTTVAALVSATLAMVALPV